MSKLGDLRFRQSHLLHELKDTAKTKGYRVTEMSPQTLEISSSNTSDEPPFAADSSHKACQRSI